MRRTVPVREKSRNGADELHGQARDPDVGTNELERSEREERRQRVADGDAPAQREAGGGADHRLLADSNVDETVAETRRQVSDRGAVFRGHHHETRVAVRDRREKVFVAGHQRTTFTSDVSVARAPP